MHLDENNRFVITATGREMSVWAFPPKGARKRWQYRMGPTTKDKLLASGMTPAAFVKGFWLRDDFVESD